MTRIAPQAHEPVELDPCRAFTPRQRLQILLASDGKCARCGVKLGKTWDCDHVVAWALGGRTEVGNGEAICPQPCHAVKSKADVKAVAKAKRLSGETGSGVKRAFVSRGFDRSKTRHFDGSVSPRARGADHG